MHVARLISPGMCILGFFEFFDELSKRRMAIAYASTIAEYGVEGRGIAVVQQPDLLIALNGAGAGSQTQESERSHCRPNHGPKMRLSFHPKKSPWGRLESKLLFR